MRVVNASYDVSWLLFYGKPRQLTNTSALACFSSSPKSGDLSWNQRPKTLCTAEIRGLSETSAYEAHQKQVNHLFALVEARSSMFDLSGAEQSRRPIRVRKHAAKAPQIVGMAVRQKTI